jgi:PPOX class probable F420-dependent enzyme
VNTTHAHYEDTSSDSAFATLGDEQFLSLTTFRKSGERVSSAMWVARDGDALIMFTPESSGKVKRLRNSPRVELRPCNRMGRAVLQRPCSPRWREYPFTSTVNAARDLVAALK